MAGEPGGLYLLNPEGNVTISGNYIEGYFGGLTVKGQYATGGWGAGGPQVTGLVITNNTIAGNSPTPGSDVTVFDLLCYAGGLPAVMNANQWGWTNNFSGGTSGSANFNVPGYPTLGEYGNPNDYWNPNGPHNLPPPSFLAWTHEEGFEGQSAGKASMSLIYAPTYDIQLDGSPTAAQAMALFRAYAKGQITTYANTAVGAAATGTDGIDGTATETLGADGTAPPAPAITYDFSAGRR